MTPVVRLALDEDFPDTILDGLQLGIREAQLVPIRHIDAKLRQMDDWKLFLSLYHLGGWDGMVTTDSRMLNLPREMAVLHQTKLALVVIEKSGHDPIRAAGLLLVHLPVICRKLSPSIGQIWKLSAVTKNHEDPMAELRKIAGHLKVPPNKLFQDYKLSKTEMSRNPLMELDFR